MGFGITVHIPYDMLLLLFFTYVSPYNRSIFLSVLFQWTWTSADTTRTTRRLTARWFWPLRCAIRESVEPAKRKGCALAANRVSNTAARPETRAMDRVIWFVVHVSAPYCFVRTCTGLIHAIKFIAHPTGTLRRLSTGRGYVFPKAVPRTRSAPGNKLNLRPKLVDIPRLF